MIKTSHNILKVLYLPKPKMLRKWFIYIAVIYVSCGFLQNTSVLSVQSGAVQQTESQRQAAQRATVFLQCMNNSNVSICTISTHRKMHIHTAAKVRVMIFPLRGGVYFGKKS